MVAALEMEVLVVVAMMEEEVAMEAAALEAAEVALVVAAEASTNRTQRKRCANDLHNILVIGKPDQRRRQLKSTDDGLVKPAGDCYLWYFWLFAMGNYIEESYKYCVRACQYCIYLF